MASSLVSSDVGVVDSVARVQEAVNDFISGAHFRRFFANISVISSIDERPNGRIIDQIVHIIQATTEDQREQCYKNIVQLAEADGATAEFKQLARNVFFECYSLRLIPLKQVCESLIALENFALTSYGISTDTVDFLMNKVNELDYKGVRDLLKLILERLQSVPPVLSQFQRRQLESVEKLVIEIISRENNHLPAYFVVTELQRTSQVTPKHQAFTNWKLAEKFSEVIASFRPLAEMVSIIDRPFMVPIAGHCSLTQNGQTWRLDQSHRLLLKGHLPYQQQYFVPQQYVIYQLLKQPRGREIIANTLLIRDRQKPLNTYDEVLCWILIEAMGACENANSNENFKYEWLHLGNLVVFSIVSQSVSFATLLTLLKEALAVTSYRKARDELMWTLLQYVPAAGGKLQVDDCKSLLDLYNLLYTGQEEMVFSGSDLSEVRRMAPTCLWIHLNKRLEYTLKPPPSIATQIKFLEESLKNESALRSDDYILAVLCNAYSCNNDAMERCLVPVLSQKWSSIDEFAPLPMGPDAPKRIKPLSVEFLDALTVHAKMILGQVFKDLLKMPSQAAPKPFSLPSPAAVDSLARLLAVSDLEYTLKPLVTQQLPQMAAQANQSYTAQLPRVQQLVHIYCELIAYRIPMAAISLGLRFSTIVMLAQLQSTAHFNSHQQLHYTLEQALLRQIVWMPSGDCLAWFNKFATAGGRQLFSEPVVKLVAQTVARAVRITGSDCSTDACQRLSSDVCWSQTAVKHLPGQLVNFYSQQCQQVLSQVENSRRQLQEQLNEQYVQWRTLTDDLLLEHFTRENSPPVFLCLVWQAIVENVTLPNATYRIAETLGPKTMSLHLIKMIDFVLSRLTNDSLLQQTVDAIDQMIWVHWLFPMDLFLFTALMRPCDDRESHKVLQLICNLLTTSNNYNARIKHLIEQLPSQHWSATDWYVRLRGHYEMFEEKNYGQIYMEKTGYNNSNITTLPVYFGNLAYRMCPVADLIIQKLIENLAFVVARFDTLVTILAPIYRFHPQPRTFLYTTLFYYETTFKDFPEQRKQLVCKINDEMVEPGRSVGWLLSDEFRTASADWLPSMDYYRDLVDKLVDGINLKNRIPHWADRDWRFSEFLNPASQALHSVCIELMAAPFEADYVCNALIRIALDSAPSNGFNATTTPNSVAAILTALPSSYHQGLFAQVQLILNDPSLLQSKPSSCLSSVEPSSYTFGLGVHMRVAALMHAFWQHSNAATFGQINHFVRDRLSPNVHKEVQLIYVCRLVIPFLQRLYVESMTNKVLQITVDLYEMLLRVDKNSEDLEMEETLCDLFYHLKYMFVGDGVKQDTDPLISQLRPSIQSKLRFISHQPDASQLSTETNSDNL